MHRWKLSALAAAALVSAALTPTDASALALGRISVQSALGEPLRAEIDIPQASPAELEALKAGIASPEVFQAHGMEYSGSARDIQVEVLRQPDGTAKLRLSSRGPVSDPFVDLVINANWSAGQLVRSYTLLLDPPQAAQTSAAPSISAPQTRAAAVAPASAPPASVTGRSYGSDAATASPPPAKPARAATAAAVPAQVTVRSGDTAGRIASASRPAGVSLDQMLVAMLRANPNAFVNGNVNRLRAGSVLQLPGKEEASATSAKEARQMVAAQSRDFNEFRRRLAAKAPAAKLAAAERAASGQVQTQVQDQSARAAAEDKLTLSKGAVQGQHMAEEKLAQAKQASAQSERVDELQRNLAELQKVAAASGAPAAASASDAAAPGIAVPVTPPPLPEAAAQPDAAATTTDTPAETPPAATNPSETAAPATPAVPAPAPVPDFMDELAPLALPAAGGVLALVLGLLGWRLLRRRGKQSDSADQAADVPREHAPLSPQEAAPATADPVAAAAPQDSEEATDPVAEAEVYLAYGRDVQAEEILRRALDTQPDRQDVHMKLAEIYAKRHDAKSLEATALHVQSLTQGFGPHWDRIVDLGRQVDASNPLYQDPETPASSAFSEALAKSQAAAPKAAAASGLAQHLPADLNLDLPGGPADSQPAEVPSSSAAEPNWDEALAESSAPPASTPLKPLDLSTLEFSLDTPPASTAAASAPTADASLDLSALNLDLGDAPPAAAPAATADDPLATKLDLAREFHAIGDSEGARTLVEEVIAEATGELKERAQRLLAEID